MCRYDVFRHGVLSLLGGTASGAWFRIVPLEEELGVSFQGFKPNPCHFFLKRALLMPHPAFNVILDETDIRCRCVNPLGEA